MPKKVRGRFVYDNLVIRSLGDNYPEIGEQLSPHFSEFGYVRHRLEIEYWWLYFLIVKGIARLPEDYIKTHGETSQDKFLDQIYDFNDADLSRINELENQVTESKAYELFMAEKLKKQGMEALVKFVHLGCSDAEMDMCAHASIFNDSKEILIEAVRELNEQIAAKADEFKDVQYREFYAFEPYVTTIGKELMGWEDRLADAFEFLEGIDIALEFSGAAKNYTTFEMIRKDAEGREIIVDWKELCKEFIEGKLGYTFISTSDKKFNNDSAYQIFNAIIELNRNLESLYKWLGKNNTTLYVLRDDVSFHHDHVLYSIKLSNAILTKAITSLNERSFKLNSFAFGNIGLAIGYSMKAIKQLAEFISKIHIDYESIKIDASASWASLVHNIRVVLKLNDLTEEEEKLSRLEIEGKTSKQELHEFVRSLDISHEDKQMLLALTPMSYANEASSW